ncbi:MAG: glutamate--tRNA ligase [Candidatus Symbiobacter sp.]|nr:glutamate--tRNA ligase [Candidatus Symbiobacter sp.]
MNPPDAARPDAAPPDAARPDAAPPDAARPDAASPQGQDRWSPTWLAAHPPIMRFAPSPTGYLHIGGARTALFNWLLAKHYGGKFYLRIEDTDRERSTTPAITAIIEAMRWLQLDYDGEIVYQFARAARHAAIARHLLTTGGAYRCFATPEELAELRAAQQAAKKPTRYDGRWRDRDPSEAAPDAPYVIRLRAPQTGATTLHDRVQGTVTVENAQMDDMVLLRADGTPTYMLAVVVDDHDMGITHVMRGDDHFTNSFRQTQLYQALGWEVPAFAHIPLIHGADGAKLSKRHGALAVDEWRVMGYLPEALGNYLVRLGWSHGDAEIFTRAEAVAWFDGSHLGKSAARFDRVKLDSLNAHYIKNSDDADLVALISPAMAARLERDLTDPEMSRLTRGMGGLKARAKTLVELSDLAWFYVAPLPLHFSEKAQAILAAKPDFTAAIMADVGGVINELVTARADWRHDVIEGKIRAYIEAQGYKLGDVASILRVALTGSHISPPIFEVIEVLGESETLARINHAIGFLGKV